MSGLVIFDPVTLAACGPLPVQVPGLLQSVDEGSLVVLLVVLPTGCADVGKPACGTGICETGAGLLNFNILEKWLIAATLSA